MFNRSYSNLSADEIIKKDKMEQLAIVTEIAIGHRTIGEFTRDCKLIDTRDIEMIVDKKLYEFPHQRLLERIANASEGRVTFEQLCYICGYNPNDTDTNFADFKPLRGEIYYANLGFGYDSEQKGVRPVLVIQNDIGNQFSGTCICIPITSRYKKILPTHVMIGSESGMNYNSIIMTEQIRCISKRRFFYNTIPSKVGMVPEHLMYQVEVAVKKALQLTDVRFNEEAAFDLADYVHRARKSVVSSKNQNFVIMKVKDLFKIREKVENDFEEYCNMYNRNPNEVFKQFQESQEETAVCVM